MNDLLELLSQNPLNIHAISKYLDVVLQEAIIRVNHSFGPTRLGKAPRTLEPLPTDTRQLSSYRTRIGTMLEYAISSAIAQLLAERYGNQFLLTFATSHEYPDFYLRDNSMTALLKIEMKAVDAESDEQAARFSTPISWIDFQRDMLLLVGWKWENLYDTAGSIVGEYPYIFASTVLPAGEIAQERDVRLEITGGKVEDDQVYVYNRKGDLVPDQGNYGKFWRIIHSTRRSSEELTETLRRFMEFLQQIDKHSSRKRF